MVRASAGLRVGALAQLHLRHLHGAAVVLDHRIEEHPVERRVRGLLEFGERAGQAGALHRAGEAEVALQQGGAVSHRADHRAGVAVSVDDPNERRGGR